MKQKKKSWNKDKEKEDCMNERREKICFLTDTGVEE
jgi:hypothetical protein